MSISVPTHSVAQADVVFESAISNGEKYPFQTLQPCLVTFHNCSHTNSCQCREKLIRIYTYMCFVDPIRGLVYMKKAQKVVPDHPHVLNNMAYLYHHRTKQYKLAKEVYTKVLQVSPTNAISYSGLGNLLHGVLGQINTAIDVHVKCIQKCPDYAPAYSDLIFCIHYIPLSKRHVKVAKVCETLEMDPCTNVHDFSAALMKLWTGKKVTDLQPFKWNGAPNDYKYAFVSADFGGHPVMDFLKCLLQGDEQVYLYNTAPPVPESRKFNGIIRNIQGESVDDILKLLYEDGITHLIDLSGHTNATRQDIFVGARHVLPWVRQFCYLGYPSHTGMEKVMKISNHFIEKGCADELARLSLPYISLPGTLWCWTPREQVALKRTDRANGYPLKRPVFGCYSKLCKINAEVVRAWKRILDETGGKLVIKNKAFADPWYADMWFTKFDGYDVELTFHSDDYQSHLESFSDIDIHLDTFPYTGTTVSFESLYMDVPCITLCGETPENRVTADIIQRLDMADLIGYDEDEYIQKAVLATQKYCSPRQKLIASPLFNNGGECLFRTQFYNTLTRPRDD